MTKAEYERAFREAYGDADDMLAAALQRITFLEDLTEMAETLLCNAFPMSHCTQEEWNLALTKWRDSKHGVTSGKLEEKR